MWCSHKCWRESLALNRSEWVPSTIRSAPTEGDGTRRVANDSVGLRGRHLRSWVAVQPRTDFTESVKGGKKQVNIHVRNSSSYSPAQSLASLAALFPRHEVPAEDPTGRIQLRSERSWPIPAIPLARHSDTIAAYADALAALRRKETLPLRHAMLHCNIACRRPDPPVVDRRPRPPSPFRSGVDACRDSPSFSRPIVRPTPPDLWRGMETVLVQTIPVAPAHRLARQHQGRHPRRTGGRPRPDPRSHRLLHHRRRRPQGRPLCLVLDRSEE